MTKADEERVKISPPRRAKNGTLLGFRFPK